MANSGFGTGKVKPIGPTLTAVDCGNLCSGKAKTVMNSNPDPIRLWKTKNPDSGTEVAVPDMNSPSKRKRCIIEAKSKLKKPKIEPTTVNYSKPRKDRMVEAKVRGNKEVQQN